MISNCYNMLLTGTRCFDVSRISRIDIWHTAENVRLVVDEDGKDNGVILDENESEVVRRWAGLAMEQTGIEAEDMLLTNRCQLQETRNWANKLNRAASRRKAAARKQATKYALDSPVIDIAAWKSSKSTPAVQPVGAPAA